MIETQERFIKREGWVFAAKNGWHPEVALGIPFCVITAKGATKQIEANLVGYTGPLTLAEAVERGMLNSYQAKLLISGWLQREPTQAELDRWMPGVRQLAAVPDTKRIQEAPFE